MKKTLKKTGVVAEKDDKYWGCQADYGGHGGGMIHDFGPIENASISNPKHCKKPEDMTYAGGPDERKLKGATLRKVTKTVTFEVE